MDKNKRVEEEIEKTLGLLENIEALEPNPYLFTRIKARLNESGSEKTALKKEDSFALKLLPAFLILLVIFNFYSIIDFSSTDNVVENTDNRSEYLQQLGNEFMLNQSSYYPIPTE